MTLKHDSAAFLDLSSELLSLGCRVRFRASGSSMHPAICHGDMITVEPVDPQSVKKGDILLFRRSGRPLAHRVVHVGMEKGSVVEFIVRGDAKLACDAPVKPEEVLGRVSNIARRWRSMVLTYLFGLPSVLSRRRYQSRAPLTKRSA
jgi:signal peptidase